MSKQPRYSGDSKVLAAVQRAGDAIRAVAARRQDDTYELIEAREFSGPETTQFAAWLAEHRVGRVIGILPASAVICRNCTLPNATPEQLEPALRLQAEAQLLGVTPPHRLAMAVLHAAEGETARTGLIFAWPESAEHTIPSAGDVPMSFMPEVGALAALLNGNRPEHPVLWLDRTENTVSLAVTHTNGAVFRGTRVDSDAWADSVTRVVAETALNAEHTAEFIDEVIPRARQAADSVRHGEAALFLPPDIIEYGSKHLEGAGTREAWWRAYGICAGAIMATLDHLDPITHLREHAIIEKPSPVDRITGALSRPHFARSLVIAAVLVLLISPLLFSGLRLMVLRSREADLDAVKADFKRVDQKLDVYRGLESNAASMTKLLGDIACCTPDGVILKSVTIDTDREVRLDGTAKDSTSHEGEKIAGRAVVALMVKNLEDSGVFTNVWPTLSADNKFGKYSFSINADIHKAFYLAKYPNDWGKVSIRDWRYGPNPNESDDGAVASVASAGDENETPRAVLDDIPPGQDPVENDDETAIASAGGGSRPPRGTGGSDNQSHVGGNAGGGGGSALDIPPPRTEAEIKAMTFDEARQALADVSRARNIRGLNDETSERVRAEWKMIMEHMRDLRK